MFDDILVFYKLLNRSWLHACVGAREYQFSLYLSVIAAPQKQPIKSPST